MASLQWYFFSNIGHEFIRLKSIAEVVVETIGGANHWQCGLRISNEHTMVPQMNKESELQILDPEESSMLRQAYLDAFINTETDYFRQRIATLKLFSDGMHSEGYLWDCLRTRQRISFNRFILELENRSELLVMADNHSRDRVRAAALWPFPPYSVLQTTSQQLLAILSALPEDIYVFDYSVSWTLVLTHEGDKKRRFCYGVGVEK
jgi:hypothetical protein